MTFDEFVAYIERRVNWYGLKQQTRGAEGRSGQLDTEVTEAFQAMREQVIKTCAQYGIEELAPYTDETLVRDATVRARAQARIDELKLVRGDPPVVEVVATPSDKRR